MCKANDRRHTVVYTGIDYHKRSSVVTPVMEKSRAYFAVKRNSVVERKVSPGRRIVVGNSGWFTESG